MPLCDHTCPRATHGNLMTVPVSVNTEAAESCFTLDHLWAWADIQEESIQTPVLASRVELATLPPMGGSLGHLALHREARWCCPEGPPPREFVSLQDGKNKASALLSPSKLAS